VNVYPGLKKEKREKERKKKNPSSFYSKFKNSPPCHAGCVVPFRKSKGFLR
jgi:hypothetical protein